MEGLKIELEPHILPRLMPNKRIYNFQIPRTTPSNGLKKLLFQGSYEICKVLPYENWANWTNFFSSWEMMKSHKKISMRVRKHKRVWANT